MRYLSILLLAPYVAMAQTGTASIAGAVLDGKTQEPVIAAWVTAVLSGAAPFSKSTKTGVRVNDPRGLLPPVKNDPSRAPNLIVGVVFGSGAFLAAAITRADQTGRDYQMSILAGVPLKLWVFSRHVTLTDWKGVPVDNLGARIPFRAIADQDQAFTLNVSGRDPQSP